MFADEFLPTYDVSDSAGAGAGAGAGAATRDALMDVDLIAVGRHKPLVGILSAARMLPEPAESRCAAGRAHASPAS